jgi:hypothetical protein
MDRLRRELGDPVFWRGFKAYTRAHVGKTVTSRDLQKSFETVSRARSVGVVRRVGFIPRRSRRRLTTACNDFRPAQTIAGVKTRGQPAPISTR